MEEFNNENIDELFSKLDGEFFSEMVQYFGSCVQMLMSMRELVVVYRAAMTEFCDRVDKGEVQPTKTYATFCELLGRPNLQLPAANDYIL